MITSSQQLDDDRTPKELGTELLKLDDENMQLRTGLEEARAWHDRQERSLSKQPPTNEIRCRRFLHREQAKLIGEALEVEGVAWHPIDTAPTDRRSVFMVCCDDPLDVRSPFVVNGEFLAAARKPGVPAHLSLRYLTHWRLLPAKPRRAPE